MGRSGGKGKQRCSRHQVVAADDRFAVADEATILRARVDGCIGADTDAGAVNPNLLTLGMDVFA